MTVDPVNGKQAHSMPCGSPLRPSQVLVPDPAESLEPRPQPVESVVRLQWQGFLQRSHHPGVGPDLVEPQELDSDSGFSMVLPLVGLVVKSLLWTRPSRCFLF